MEPPVQTNPYLDFLRTWFLVILLGVVVAGYATHQALQEREPLYRATSTLQVGRLLDDRSPNQNDLAVIERLIPIYGELARRDNVLDAASESLQTGIPAADLRGMMHVIAIPQTQLIDIQFVTNNPELSAALANEVARQVVLQSPGTETDQTTSPDFISVQLLDLQQKITSAQEELAEIDARILSLTSAAEVFDAQERRTLLLAQIDSWQQTYATLLSSAEPTHSNIVRIANTAAVPTTPVPDQVVMYYGLAVVAGAGLATLLSLGLSMLGRNLRTTREVRELGLHLPVVGVPRYQIPQDGIPVAQRDPDAPATSAYRVLRNTFMVRHADHERIAVAVTSTRPGEGKTTTVANLGITLANSGLKVLLVDANLRNPELDIVLGIETTIGFSDLLLGEATIDQVWQPSDHHNLAIIGAGSVPLHYTDLLSSVILSHLVSDLTQHADIVIFDTPALMQEQESQLLAQHVHGVLVIAEAGRVNAQDLQTTLDNLERASATVLAIVLNKMRVRRIHAAKFRWSREARIEARARARQQERVRKAHVEPHIADLPQYQSALD
jgi:polysaccharide biosynthesis transport protein